MIGTKISQYLIQEKLRQKDGGQVVETQQQSMIRIGPDGNRQMTNVSYIPVSVLSIKNMLKSNTGGRNENIIYINVVISNLKYFNYLCTIPW